MGYPGKEKFPIISNHFAKCDHKGELSAVFSAIYYLKDLCMWQSNCQSNCIRSPCMAGIPSQLTVDCKSVHYVCGKISITCHKMAYCNPNFHMNVNVRLISRRYLTMVHSSPEETQLNFIHFAGDPKQWRANQNPDLDLNLWMCI